MFGLFGLHVLAVDTSVGHGAFVTSGLFDVVEPSQSRTSSPDSALEVAEPPGVLGAQLALPLADLGSGVDHQSVTGCLLVLVTVGTLLLLAALARRFVGSNALRSPAQGGPSRRRRRPASRWPRLALCVIRT